MTNFDPRSAPLAEIEELGELKRRYGIYDSATLRRWAAAVTGSHRRAMEELLRERGGGGPIRGPAPFTGFSGGFARWSRQHFF